MRVLSLYEGISCGMAAFDRAGIPVEAYDAFEIDKYAVKVSEKNYPQIVHHGDVFDGDFTQFKGYDILIGGSPCTYWSIAKNDREITPDGMGGKLFMEYVRALRESGCRYFLYENNYSIHKNIKAFISEQLGVEPIMINSALVSAQNRKRCYWTNIPGVTQPEDRGIMLRDILEDGISWVDKSYCLTASYDGAVLWNTLERKQRTMVAVPVNDENGKARTLKAQYSKSAIANAVRDDGFGATMVAESVNIPKCVNSQSETKGDRKQPSLASRIYSINGKNPAVTTCFHTNVAVPVGVAQRGRYIESGKRNVKCEGGTEQFFEARKDEKANCLTTVQKDSMVAIPIDTESVLTVREATKKGYTEIQAGECVDLGMPNSKTRRGRKMSEKSNCLTTSIGFYEYLGKSAIPLNTYNNEGEKSRTFMAGYYKYGEATLLTNESFKGGATAVAMPVRIGEYGKGGQGQRIYSVKGKSVTLSANGGGQGAKTGLYKIDLPDGDYIIRKLTPVEAERLQTLPDNYTEGISKTQRYKCIGNGWTVEVIAHILNNLKNEVS